MNSAQIIQLENDKMTVHDLKADETYIGRSHENDVVLDQDACISRRHAVIARVDGSYTLCDLLSRNGTLLNGRRLRGTVQLKQNDEILVGTTKFFFCSNIFDTTARADTRSASALMG